MSATARRRTGRDAGRGATRKTVQKAEPRSMSFNWLNRLLILFSGAAVMAAGLQAYSVLASLPVERISVTGDLQHTQTEAVQEMVQPALVGGFLSADLDRIRAQLEALPWIYRASVRRRWPSSLEIHVLEQLPIARWGHGGFLNHEGEVFQSANADAWQHLPRLVGPEGSERELMVRYQRLEELLADVELEVQTLELDERGQLEAQLVQGMTLVLGNEALRERVARFVTVYAGELAARADEVARVDLRYPSGLAVAFHEPAQVAGLATD